MALDELINILTKISPLSVLKVLTLTLIAFYATFAFIVIRQVDLMGKTVEVPLTSFLKLLAALHFLATLALFLLGLAIL